MREWQWHFLEINPEPWAIGPVGYARRNNKMAAYVGRNAQLDAYKNAIKEELGNGYMLIEGKVELRFYFWRNRAEYETPQARTHRKHEADVTNLQKATEDALQGVLFKNDKDTNVISSVMVAQGPGVVGKIVIAVRQGIPNPNIFTELPDHIRDQIDELDNGDVDQLVLPFNDDSFTSDGQKDWF